MSNPPSRPDADQSDTPAVNAATSNARPVRKGPRRATSPAGTPVKSTTQPTSLLIVDAAGKVVPPAPGAPATSASPEAPISSANVPPSPAASSQTSASPSAPSSASSSSYSSASSASSASSNTASSQTASSNGAGPLLSSPASPSSAAPESAASDDKSALPDRSVIVDKATAATQGRGTEKKLDSEHLAEPKIEEAAVAGADGATKDVRSKTAVSKKSVATEDAGQPAMPSNVSDEDSLIATKSALGPKTPVSDTTPKTTSSKKSKPDAKASEEAKPNSPTADKVSPGAPAQSSETDATANSVAEVEVATVNGTASVTTPATTSATTTTIAAADVDADVTPLSRRERRLAEQKDPSGVELSSSSTTKSHPDNMGIATPSHTDSAGDANKSSKQAPNVANTGSSPATAQRKRNRFVATLRGMLFLIVIAAMVAALGTVVSGQNGPANSTSETELNRQAAWDSTSKLLIQSTALGAATSNTELQAALRLTTQQLTVQAAALGDGLPPETVAATAAATTSRPTVSELVRDMQATGETLLASAVSAEHAMGRVFASVGTSQLIQSQTLADIVGANLLATKYLPVAVDFPEPVAPECTSTLAPRTGVTVDSALGAAATAEQKAVHAYQVASTRLAEPESGEAQILLARHEQKLAVLNGELQVRCLPLITPVAGYTIDPVFMDEPVPALANLESELSSIYSELAALSQPAPVGTSLLAADAATGSPAASESHSGTSPAISQQPESDAASVGYLREISVAWLLDSSTASTQWGGTVGALAGMTP